MRVEPIDVQDDEALRAFQRIFAEAESHGREHATPWQLAEMTVTVRRASAGVELEPFVAVEAGRVLGAGLLEVPSMDNPHLTNADVAVPPSLRGQGIGSALVSFALRRTAELGRSSVTAAISVPLDSDHTHPYARFAARHGFTRRLVELHQVMDFPAPADLLDRLAEHTTAHRRDYHLLGWGDTCPDELVAPFCALLEAMGGEAPMGTLDVEPERWDAERLRDTERRRVEQGRSSYTTVAVAPDGSVAGYTQLGVPAHDPQQCFQWDTLVLPPHRGHRLGLALKVANLQRARAEHSQRRVMHTWNAASNAPMLAVNGALGFRPVERVEEWQRDLRAGAAAGAA